MSTCDPNSPVACEKCRNPKVEAVPFTVFSPSEAEREELEEMLGELKGLRLGARELKRSGNPAVKAEGVKALAHIEDQIQWVRSQLSKED